MKKQMYAFIPQKLCGMAIFWILHPGESPLHQALTATTFLHSVLFAFLHPPWFVDFQLDASLIQYPKAQVAMPQPFWLFYNSYQ